MVQASRGGQALQRRTSPPEADKPSAVVIKIRSVALALFCPCESVWACRVEASCEAWSVANLHEFNSDEIGISFGSQDRRRNGGLHDLTSLNLM